MDDDQTERPRFDTKLLREKNDIEKIQTHTCIFSTIKFKVSYVSIIEVEQFLIKKLINNQLIIGKVKRAF